MKCLCILYQSNIWSLKDIHEVGLVHQLALQIFPLAAEEMFTEAPLCFITSWEDHNSMDWVKASSSTAVVYLMVSDKTTFLIV